MAEPGPEREIAGFEYVIAGLAPLIGFLVLWGPRFLNRENIYLGAIQEQYYLLGQYAFDHLIQKEFAQGLFPLWNPNNALGAPLLGNMLSAVFYPLKIFLYLFPGPVSYQLYLIFRFWMAGFFSYLLARKLRLSIGASLFALLGFTFSGYFQLFLNENYLNADFLLPLLALLAMQTARSKSRKWPLFLALGFFALFNSGHPEAIFYDWLFAALSFAGFAFSLKKNERRAAAMRFALSNLAAGFLSLPLALTFLEYWVRGCHFHLPGAGLYHYSAKELLSILTPWIFGPGSPGAAFFHPPELGRGLSGFIPGYREISVPWLAPSIGLVFLPFLAIGIAELRRIPRLYLVWFGWLIFFAGFSFGLPLFQLLGLVFPFSLSGNFKHPWPGLILSASLISAYVLDRMFAGRVSARKSLLAIAAGAGLLAIFFPHEKMGAALSRPVVLELGAVAVLFGWIYFTRSIKGADKVGILLACLVILISASLRVSWQEPVYPGYNLARLRGNPVFKKIARDHLARFYFDREIFPANINQLLEVAGLSVMDGINHHRFVELVDFINGHTREQGFKYWYNKVGFLEIMPEMVEHPLTDLMGLKYVVSKSPLPYQRTIERILDHANRTAPSPGHIGQAYFPLGQAFAKTLFQHPPSRIDFDRCDLYQEKSVPAYCDSRLPRFLASIQPVCSVGFYPRIDRKAWEKEPDGVWFVLSSKEDLSYARYIHPRMRLEERELPRARFNLSGCRSFSLVTLPGQNPDFDWAGWMDLRIDEPDAPERFKLLSASDFWFYENPDAIPMFFMAESGEWEKAVDQETANLDKAAGIYEQLVLLQEPAKASTEGDYSGDKISVTGFSSQRYVVQAELQELGWIGVSQIFYPGWRVYVDDKERKFEAASLISAVEVPKGKHRLELVYEPWSFRIGLYFAIGSLAFLFLLAAVKVRPAPGFEQMQGEE